MKNSKPLTEEEIKVLKSARKILRKIQNKYNRWDDKCYKLSDQKFVDESRKMDEWMSELYVLADVDFADNTAFIDF